MFIDSHCHLDMDPLSRDVKGALTRAKEVGVGCLINVGADLAGSRNSVNLAAKFPEIWASIGLHPHESVNFLKNDVLRLKELAADKKVVAIGEIGLDYFNPESSDGRLAADVKKKQIELFESQLDLATKLKKPVIFHVRDAWADFFNIIENFETKRLAGVVHCFTGTPAEAEQALESGLLLGFTGFVTFKQVKFNHIRKAAQICPLDRLLIETDAPFLAPEPHRGRTNEPAFVVEVAKKVSELKSASLSEVAEKTLHNAKKLFVIK